MVKLIHWKVVVVDDEPDSLKLVQDMLTENGAEVFAAASGKEGLAFIESIVPTLVVVDLSMPRPDGWDLLNAVQAHPALKQVPVVAITAFYSEQVERRAYQAGFSLLIRKPIRMASFLGTLESLMA